MSQTQDIPAFVNVALYGANGHQIQNLLAETPLARLVATAEFPLEKIPTSLPGNPEVRSYRNLDEILDDPRVELVSLCSPRRCDQAADTIRALRAGKHVYAEKPCAMEEADLEVILQVSRETGRLFREMADTAFWQPYETMRRIVQSGRIGRVVQVTAEKSYPYHDGRPQDEDVDGGLIQQSAIHAIRMVEHVAGVRVQSVQARETTAGNPVPEGGLRMAASLMMTLEGGGLASITANYLNPRGTGTWGYESLRIYGDQGMIESTEGGQRTRLVIGDQDHGALKVETPNFNYLEAYLKTILGKESMPLTLEEEVNPTRWAIRARKSAMALGQVMS